MNIEEGLANEYEILSAVKGISVNRLRELAEAERCGRVVILPCFVGDNVYLTIHGIVEETKVRTFFIGHPSYNSGEPNPSFEMVRCTNFDLPLNSFGKTVFCTREDANNSIIKKENT